MKLKYIGPFDEIDIPDIGQTVFSRKNFEVTEDEAAALLAQPLNFAPVDAPAKKLVADFTEEERAAHAGVPFELPFPTVIEAVEPHGQGQPAGDGTPDPDPTDTDEIDKDS